MSPYVYVTDEELKTILEVMVRNRRMGFPTLAENLPSPEVILREVTSVYGMRENWEYMAAYLLRRLTMLNLDDIASLVKTSRERVVEMIRTMESQIKNDDQEATETAETIVKNIRLTMPGML